VIEEGLEHYQMQIPVVGLTEMIAEHLAAPAPQAPQTPARKGA
jgi:hypothetical protein